MFAVHPKTDCPHLDSLDLEGIRERLSQDVLLSSCQTCGDDSENWVCLECEGSFCSRYVNGHMATHNDQEGHAVALSLSDASVWCYSCDSYVTSPSVDRLTRKLGALKFPESMEESEQEDANQAPQKPSFSYTELVDNLRDKSLSKVAFLTGAGISVAAGIPDFRTPGTGLYAKVAELGLPHPEAIFSLDYLKENPLPFFKIANGFLTYKASPVKSHYFIKKVADEGQLLMNFTQNIDGLELDAGVPQNLLVQAHGHMRTAHCIECGASAPITEFFAHVALEKVFYCVNCDSPESEIRGIVKPDVVFFGETLPASFALNVRKITQADVVFVMGTSLKVFPFAALLHYIEPGVPVVLVNREDPGSVDTDRNPLVFLKGEIEESIAKLAEDLGWTLDGPRAAAQAEGGETPAAPISGEKA
jgi:NAD-dependent SIR2 family protein deacetylase